MNCGEIRDKKRDVVFMKSCEGERHIPAGAFMDRRAVSVDGQGCVCNVANIKCDEMRSAV